MSKLAKLKIGQVAKMTHSQIEDLRAKGLIAPGSEIKDFLGKDDDNVYYDARPDLIGEIVSITEVEGDTYSVDLDGYAFSCGKESLEFIESKPALKKFENLTTQKLNKPRKSRKPAVAKKSGMSQVFSGNRLAQIESCEVEGCNGEPAFVEFELPTCTGLKCVECFLIKTYTLK